MSRLCKTITTSLATLLVAVVSSPVFAASATAHSKGGLDTDPKPTAKVSGTATGTAAAYSAVTPGVNGPNASTSGTLTVGPTSTNISAGLAPFTIKTKAGGVIGVADIGRPKFPAPQQVVVLSNTSGAGGTAVGRGQWNSTTIPGRIFGTNPASSLNAEAFVTVDQINQLSTGFAAGYASDPYLAAAGSYDYDVTLDPSLLVQATPNAFADLTITGEALGLTNGGSPNATWSLDISESGNGLLPAVQFQSTGLGLNNLLITQDVMDALNTSVANTATLLSQYSTSGFQVFDTTLASSTDFIFGETDTATASAQEAPTPEPSGTAILLLGTGAFTLVRARRRRAS